MWVWECEGRCRDLSQQEGGGDKEEQAQQQLQGEVEGEGEGEGEDEGLGRMCLKVDCMLHNRYDER